MSTAIFLENPKTPFNVASAIRAGACYGIDQVWWSGTRVSDDREVARRTGTQIGKKKWRLPREERMKVYDLEYGVNDFALHDLVVNHGFTPVCVELVEGAETMPFFEHPEGDTVYVFGPEDGGVSKGTRHFCHRFVQIPTLHCINLGAAVYTTLYDREAKLLTRVTV